MMEYRSQQQSKGDGKDSYVFPTLKPQEILQCMNNLQIPFSDDELAKPTARNMQIMYEAFTDIFMGVTRDQFEQPGLAVIADLDYPAFYEDSISHMAFYRHLIKFMSEIGVDNFSLRDLIKPEGVHVRRVLSAIINFAKFREDKMVIFDQYTQRSDELLDRRQELEQQNHELRERVKALKIQRQQQEPAIKNSKELNASLTNELREFRKQQERLTGQVDELKKIKASLTDKLTANQYLVINAKQDCVKLKSRVVQSPEKLKQAIAEMSNSLVNEKGSVAMVEKRARELQTKFDMMEVVEQEIQTCISLMKECDAQIEKFETGSRKAQQTKEGIEEKKIELRDLGIKDQQLKRQLASSEEKIQRLQHQYQMKRESTEGKLVQLQGEYAQIQNERDTVQSKIDENKRIVDSTERKVSELRVHMEQEMYQLEQEYSKLKTQVEYYQNELLQSIGIAGNEVAGVNEMDLN